MRESTLSAQQHHQLEAFQTITQIRDEAKAIDVLNKHSWDLNGAVSDVMESGVEVEPRTHFRKGSQQQSNFSRSDGATTDGTQYGAYRSLSFLRGLAARSLNALTPILKYPFFGGQLESTAADSQHVLATQLHYRGRPLNIMLGPYSDAAAKSSGSLLFVYLHSPLHQDTESFLRQTLCTEVMCEYLDRAEVVSWAGDISQNDGHWLAGILGVHGYPFIAVLGPGENSTSTSSCILYRHTGHIEPEALKAQISHYAHTAQGEQLRNHQAAAARLADRLLRMQQDREYEETLQRDMELIHSNAQPAQRGSQVAPPPDQYSHTQSPESNMGEFENAAEEWARDEVAVDIHAFSPEPSSSDCISVCVRLPGPLGGRITRRFLPSELLESVYKWVEAAALKPNALDEAHALYVLVSSMPRRIWSDRSVRLGDLVMGSSRQVMLFLEEKEADDSEGYTDEYDDDSDL